MNMLVVKIGTNKNKTKNLEAHTPKLHQEGTVKRYLSDMQNQILSLLKKHLLKDKTNPILTMCQLFREAFAQAYK